MSTVVKVHQEDEDLRVLTVLKWISEKYYNAVV
jgi:hypothetical protein